MLSALYIYFDGWRYRPPILHWHLALFVYAERRLGHVAVSLSWQLTDCSNIAERNEEENYPRELAPKNAMFNSGRKYA